MMDYFLRQRPVIGEKGQKKLMESSVLIAGCGGLGTNVAQQLVRLGIGKIYLVDNGIIDAPDLNRQILYYRGDIGRKKGEVIEERINAIGLITDVIISKEKITENFDLPEGIIGIVDCLDNFETRYILDDLVHKKKLFLIHGGIRSMCGQITTIIPGKTPSLRKIFGNIKGKKEVIPIIGQTPSVIASLQAIEVVKLVCGLNNTLVNRMLFIDLNDYTFKTIELNF